MPVRRRLLLALLLLAAPVPLLLPGAPAAPGPSWESLLAQASRGLPQGFTLSPPRRGAEHDVVVTASRNGQFVQLHLLDRGRWPGVRETTSFQVAWEERAGDAAEQREPVTIALHAALSALDPGGLGPVDAIPLRAAELRPLVVRVLDQLDGWRGPVVGLFVAGAAAVLSTLPGGALWAALLLLGLGLALRLPELGVPYVHDQDVQRIFTAHLPLGDLLATVARDERHPPLFFLLLHAVERLFGQGERAANSIAAFSGALVGPALVLAVRLVRGRAGPAAALAGLALTVSPALIARSREVSSLTLFAVLALLMAATALRAAADTRTGGSVAVTHALGLWTFHLAPVAMALQAALLAALRRFPRRLALGLAAGVALGAPALWLAARAFVRDQAAREAAHAFPALAWGEHSPAGMLRDLGALSVSTLGWPLLLLFAVALVLGMKRRDEGIVSVAGTLVLAALALALLTLRARIQAYYLLPLLPLAALAVALAAQGAKPLKGATAALFLVAALWAVPRLPEARAGYVPAASMPGIAQAIRARLEPRVLVLAHYDATLLAYYLARAEGLEADWATLRTQAEGMRVAGRTLTPLLRVHALGADWRERLRADLDRELASGPALLVRREGLGVDVPARCDELHRAPELTLLRCERLTPAGAAPAASGSGPPGAAAAPGDPPAAAASPAAARPPSP